MNIRENKRLEKRLVISETDIVNGGEHTILTVYAVKENDEMWSYPAPQIDNRELYEKNKSNYDTAVKEFRNDCEVE